MNAMARRLKAVERHLGRPADVTWQEAYAADDRLNARLLAEFEAMAGGREPPADDEAQDAADEEVLRRWRRQRGIAEEAPVSDAELLDQMNRIATAVPA